MQASESHEEEGESGGLVNNSSVDAVETALRILGVVADAAPHPFEPYFEASFSAALAANRSAVGKHPKISIAVMQCLAGLTVGFFTGMNPGGAVCALFFFLR